MPDGVLEALKFIRDRIGMQAVTVILLAFMVTAFVKDIPSIGKLQDILTTVGFGLFALGLAMGLLHLFADLFAHRPARGLIDGLVAGSIAGIVGGYFGFGFHSGPTYVDPWYARTLLCLLFATPVGGVLGLCFDVFQADRAIPWRAYLGVMMLALVALFATIAFGLFKFVPEMRGHGIIVSDLQLLFETFLIVSVAMTAVAFRWSLPRIGVGAAVLATSLALARATTMIAPADATQFDTCTHLSCSEFFSDAGDRADFVVVTLILMTWSICTFAAVIRSETFAARR